MKRHNLIENRSYNIEELTILGLEQSTLDFLQKNSIVENSNNIIQFNFIGSIYIKDQHLLVHPKYRKSFFTKEETELFHSSLIKFNNLTSLISGESLGNWKNIYDILEDFNINGYFKSYNKNYKFDWSNPSWEQMFNQPPSIVNNTIFWEKPISASTSISSESLRDLHIQIIHYLLIKFPIMKNFFSSMKNLTVPTALPDTLTLTYNIQSEIQKTTFSRESSILKKTLKVIQHDLISEGLIVGTKHVHNFWEQLCKVFLNDVSYKWIPKFPRAQWNIKLQEGKTSPHKPDIISEHNNKIFLYDAKYYDTNSTQPGIQDITKQILYKKCIESIKEDVIVCNGFLFPSDDPTDHYEKKTGEIEYNIFGIDTTIHSHHQYDIELFKHYC